MDKAPDAFRTISEVAEVLDTPAHVLRFWESRFPQIRPVKRAGGRRYYRPADVALLAGIRQLLHEQGMTIRGVQKILRENGVRHVQTLSRGLLPNYGDITEASEIEAALEADFLSGIEPAMLEGPDEEDDAPGGEVVPMPRRARDPALRLLIDSPPAAANTPEAAEIVPEAPFIEAEPETAEILSLPTSPVTADLFAEIEDAQGEVDLPAPDAPDLDETEDDDDLIDLDPPEDDMAAEDLADLAAMDGLDAAMAAVMVDADPAPATPGPHALPARLRALPAPVSPSAHAALLPLLVQARTLLAARNDRRG